MRTLKHSLRIVAGAALLVAAGCATPGLPETPAPRAPQGPGEGSVTATVIQRAQHLYLYPERLDERVLVGALDALESRFDSVRFDHEEGAEHGILSVGSRRARVPLETELDAERFDAVLARALRFVETGLGDEANQDESSDLELVALRGALHALDHYSTIFAGRGTEDFQIRFSGKLHGIGARIGRRDGSLMAMRVFPESPAARAGLQDGDAILYIDGNPTRPLTVGEAVEQIRGEAGTPVVLGILREEEEQDIEIIRGEVVVPSVETRSLEDGIGYARISSISRATVGEFRSKLLELGPLSGLVLDLRGNSGGSMSAAKDLADFFLEEGMIVRIVSRQRGHPRRRHSGALATRGVVSGAAVVVLVDPATASAAEILAGAIAPLARTTLVGQTTFGKGLIQRVLPLPDERLLKLTVGEYVLSEDRAIHEKGIEPDIVLFPVSAGNLGRLAEVPEDALPYIRRPGEDDTFPIELARALLLQPPTDALAAMRAESRARIEEELAPFEVAWTEPEGLPEGALPEPLRIVASSAVFVGGEPGALRVRVENPNEFAIPEAWVALEGPAEFLLNQMVPLGTIPSGGTAEGELELTAPAGLGASSLAVTFRAAAGQRPLQSEEVILDLSYPPPAIEIELVRREDESVSVTLYNRGCCAAGGIRVAVRGAVRSLEGLAPGASETLELPLTGKAEFVSLLRMGAGVQRRVEVPIPEDRATFLPPEVQLEDTSWLGRRRVRVRAQADEGLAEGWISLDGQKAIYVAWDGRRDGQLRANLDGGEHSVTTKVETISGVAVIESRELTGD